MIETIAPMIRRVVAPNPSPFTFHGTGTYLIGKGRVAVVDPGPASQAHVDAILQGLIGEQITHILVTHTHQDHSSACRLLQAACGAPTYGFGPHGAGKLEIGAQVEEGGDMDFAPDIEVRHGDVIAGDGWSVECVHTPGHTSNHVCYQLREQRALFTGDHVMGWSTSIISPPDGDMGDYLSSLRLLLHRSDMVYWPTHGPQIDDPLPFVHSFIQHRLDREGQVINYLKDGVHRIGDMVPLIYQDLPRAMHPAAARQVFATLVYLAERDLVACETPLSVDASYYLISEGLTKA